MSTAKMVFHGSDIEKICEVYQLKSEEIVKFGANVNPLGLSEHVKEQLAGRLDILSSYPDRDYTSLRSTISEYCNIPAKFILPGNGSSELIALLIQERNPKHTLILGPTYSEYSRELSFSGSTQEYYHLREEDNFVLDVDDFCRTLDGKYDFLILCNPNNPTSSAISINDLRRIVSFCNERNIFVMIDETYVEFATDINEITAVSLTREPYDSARRIKILRSPRYASWLRNHREPGISQENERKTGTMVSQQSGSPGRRADAPG